MKMQSAYFLSNFTQGDQRITLDDKESHHAISVRRVKLGEKIYVTNGEGLLAAGEVISLDKKLEVEVHNFEQISKTKKQITVLQAVLKGDRSDFAVELMSEVGVSQIAFWSADRSVARIEAKSEKVLQRWQLLAAAATKQSRQAWLPKISYCRGIEEAIELFKDHQEIYLLDYEAEDALSIANESSRILFIVGPEGGLTEDEKSIFTSHGAKSINIGKTVLRGSTAGAVAAAVAFNLARSQND